MKENYLIYLTENYLIYFCQRLFNSALKQLLSLAVVICSGKDSQMRQQQEIVLPCGVKLVIKTDTFIRMEQK